MKKRLGGILMLAALATGLSGVAWADDWDHGRGRDDDDHRASYDRRDGRPYGTGFRDGRYDGHNDKFTGHSYRPTYSSNYKHADREYFSGWGERHEYKEQYRSGYRNGYERGYGDYRGR